MLSHLELKIIIELNQMKILHKSKYYFQIKKFDSNL